MKTRKNVEFVGSINVSPKKLPASNIKPLLKWKKMSNKFLKVIKHPPSKKNAIDYPHMRLKITHQRTY